MTTPTVKTKRDRDSRVHAAFHEIEVAEAVRRRAEENLCRWLEDPAFADARPQLESLLEAGNYAALFDAFFQDIPFGTGGRRGPVGYGPNRINLFTISTSIEGHCVFLAKRFPDVKEPSVVVAYDVRVFSDIRGVYDRSRPNPLLGKSSKDFARVAASVYAANGVRVWMCDPAGGQYLSTPELSFMIRELRALGGLNVSASHNHPDDNGAKIYNHHGSQEIPPTDEELAKIVEGTSVAKTMPFEEAVARGLVRWVGADLTEAYQHSQAGVSRNSRARSASVVFTPLHGTGFSSAGTALQRAGFRVDAFPLQSTPDGSFPTVPFRSPNPEVRESLLAATEYARSRGADLVLGTDPDADRLGMVAPVESEWRFFNGNEIGVILTYYLTGEGARGRVGGRPFGIATAVTTSLFGRMARSRGIHVIDDLGVGFKYIAEVLNRIEGEGRYGDLEAGLEDFVLAMEESHGYLVVPTIRDKDAAGAAVLLSEIASLLKDGGKDFGDYLDEVYREFGYVRNFLVNTVMQGARGFVNIRRIQESIRTDAPPSVAGRRVLKVVDRWDEKGPFGKMRSETDRMSRDLITLFLEGEAKLTLRPSGTESKNKVYVEVAGEPLGKDAPPARLAAEKESLDLAAKEIGRAFTREMLGRIGVSLPDYALEISDLVSLEQKLDFVEKLLPEILKRLGAGEVEGIDPWLDQRLKAYGSDGRLLVSGAIRAFLKSNPQPSAVESGLRRIFRL